MADLYDYWDEDPYTIDPKLIVKDSTVRGAIPILPLPLATILFVFNLIVPGSGDYALCIFEFPQDFCTAPPGDFSRTFGALILL